MVSGYIPALECPESKTKERPGFSKVDLAPQGLTNRTKRMLNIFLVLAVRCRTFHNAQESTPA